MQWSKATHQFIEQLTAETTKKGYLQNLNQFERYLVSIGVPTPIQVKDITKINVESYLRNLEVKQHCKPSTCQRHYYALSSFFTYAWNEEWIATRPTVGIELEKVEKATPVFITSKECEELLQVIKNPVIAMAIRCQFETGLRVAECLNLKLESINLMDNTLFVKEGKGGKDRVVPFTVPFAKKFSHYLQHDRPGVESSCVFATKRTGKLSPAYLNREIKKAVQELGWQHHITCHTLRHSFASHQMNAGVPIVQIQQWLGHESLASTGIYAHLELERNGEQSLIAL